MTSTHLTADWRARANRATVHVVATSLEGTREALEAATALARGLCGRVVVFLRRPSTDLNASDQTINNDDTEQALRRLAHSYTPRPNVLSCVCPRAADIVQLFRSPGLVVVGGKARWWWPTAEQRLAEDLTRLGCHVTFVHVPRGRFVPPFLAPARERARQATQGQWDKPNAR
jgi:hypothetical protein